MGNVAQQESSVDQVGKVLGTNPTQGTQVAERSTVDLTVGSGPAFVNVPALTGMSVADATALLKSQGLLVGKQTNQQTSDATQVGKVVNSSPGPGVRVKGGSSVDIAVGVQATGVAVPDVTGQDKDTAKQTLEDKGFDVSTNTVDGGGQKDTVLSTDPPAGTQAQQGSKVTMNVSKGNQPSAVPDVRGQTADPGQADPQAGRVHQRQQPVVGRQRQRATAGSSTRARPRAARSTPTSRSRCSSPRGTAVATTALGTSSAAERVRETDAMRVLVIDNYDSFVYNLVQYLAQLGADVTVRRNDEVDLDELAGVTACW